MPGAGRGSSPPQPLGCAVGETELPIGGAMWGRSEKGSFSPQVSGDKA